LNLYILLYCYYLESDNSLADGESYLNISVKYQISQSSLEMLNTIMNEVKNENTYGDCNVLLIYHPY